MVPLFLYKIIEWFRNWWYGTTDEKKVEKKACSEVAASDKKVEEKPCAKSVDDTMANVPTSANTSVADDCKA